MDKYDDNGKDIAYRIGGSLGVPAETADLWAVSIAQALRSAAADAYEDAAADLRQLSVCRVSVHEIADRQEAKAKALRRSNEQ